jgi:predicted RNA-binding protein with EMAP domain
MFQDSPENPEFSNITFYLSIISSSLLAISEILPYISQIKSNGILQLFISFIKSFKQNNEYTPLNPENVLQENETIDSLYNSINSLINELRSYKDFLNSYLHDKKINISVS